MKIHRFSIAAIILSVTISVGAASVKAETSVQWGENENQAAASGELRWSKPKIGNHYSKSDSSTSLIRLVQHTEPVRPASEAQRDLVYPEKRLDLSASPPAGAVSVPSGVSFNSQTEHIDVDLKDPSIKTVDQVDNGLNPSSSGRTAPAPDDDFYASDAISARNREIICPGETNSKSILDISYDIRPMPGSLPKECPLLSSPYNGRNFNRTCFQWKASALCTKGAYFEDVQLERYGHSVCPVMEPVISGARFFLTVPMLPYKMGLRTPDECVYTLGYYRADSCAPYMLDPFPITVRAMLFEGAAIGGAVALIP